MKKLFENWRKNLNEAAFEPVVLLAISKHQWVPQMLCLKKMQCASWLISLVLK